MTVQTPSPPQPQTTEAGDVAAEHQFSQAVLRFYIIEAMVEAFYQIVTDNMFTSWFGGVGDKLLGLLGFGKETVASQAREYVIASLAAQGIRANVPQLNALTFANAAADGRSLESLLIQPLVQARAKILAGESTEEAMRSGEMMLRRIAFNEMVDAARQADAVAVAASDSTNARTGKKVVVGWIRMLNPPSCGRCIVLAGKWYRWNAGFKRHEMCDCRAIPAAEATSDDLTTNPYEYFDSLTEQEQNDAFGVGNAEAIREGADIAQVVNASRKGSIYTIEDRRYTREGTTRRGLSGLRSPGQLRPTPGQIMRESNGNRARAVSLLMRFGYIIQ